jgi:hypothetical protein
MDIFDRGPDEFESVFDKENIQMGIDELFHEVSFLLFGEELSVWLSVVDT